MSANAEYASSPRTELCALDTANANRDGTGTIVPFFTAHAENGSRIDAIHIAARGVVTDGFVRGFFRKSSGDPWSFWWETPVPATTPVAGVTAAWMGGYQNLAWILGPGAQVGFATEKSEAFTVMTVMAGDF